MASETDDVCEYGESRRTGKSERYCVRALLYVSNSELSASEKSTLPVTLRTAQLRYYLSWTWLELLEVRRNQRIANTRLITWSCSCSGNNNLGCYNEHSSIAER